MFRKFVDMFCTVRCYGSGCVSCVLWRGIEGMRHTGLSLLRERGLFVEGLSRGIVS